jgi:DNA-binding MarR family transcriptional regulator
MKNRQELPQLFFETRQLIRSKLPHKAGDHNEWMRCETLRYVGSATPPPIMQELAGYLRVKAPSATSIIRLLSREKLITRLSEKKDKRVVRLVLTEKGRARVKKYLEDSTSTMTKVFSKISDSDVATLARILRSLQEAHRD